MSSSMCTELSISLPKEGVTIAGPEVSSGGPRVGRAGTEPSLSGPRVTGRGDARLSLTCFTDLDGFTAGDDTMPIIDPSDPFSEEVSADEGDNAAGITGVCGGGPGQDNWDRPDYHCHVPRPGKNRLARNQLMAVSSICLVFMIGEIIGKILCLQ